MNEKKKMQKEIMKLMKGKEDITYNRRRRRRRRRKKRGKLWRKKKKINK